MKFTWRLLPSFVAVLLVVVGVVWFRQPAVAVDNEVLPDLQTVIPRDSFSIVNSAQGREFRYTHLIFNKGPGPLEVQPHYDETSGSYLGEQLIYQRSSPSAPPSTWTKDRSIRVADTFTYHAAHGHFHFPLATFGLYADDHGKIGDAVALSPKIGFCIDDSYVYDTTVPNAGETVAGRGACSDPNSLRGLSIGGADEYNYLDPGQSIPIGDLNGTFWFRAVSDPYNDFLESNEDNNEADVHVSIQGSTVIVLPDETRYPSTTPPSGTLRAPSEGAIVKGSTTLVADAHDGPDAASKISSVTFVVDGVAVGTRSEAPYAFDLDTTSLVDGTHWFAARVTDAAGRTGTTKVNAATIANAPVEVDDGLRLAANVSSDGDLTATANLTDLQAGDQLVALVSGDGPQVGSQSAVMTSSTALTWSAVATSNTQPGVAGIWAAKVPAASARLAVTASLSQTDRQYPVSLTVLLARGAKGIGASNSGSGMSAVQSASLNASAQGSMVVAVGSDWDNAASRSVPDTQEIVHERISSNGDTQWVQRLKAVTGAVGEKITMSASGPAAGHYNLAAVEITSNSPGDRSAPRVQLTDPAPASEAPVVLTGLARLAATAADNVGVTRVDFLVDGRVVGSSSAPPYAIVWSSTGVSKGAHVVTAKAYDRAGNVAVSSGSSIMVDNSKKPPSRITVTAKAVGRSSGLESSSPGTIQTDLARLDAKRLLLAFVAQDGPEGGQQGATLTGGGLTWNPVTSLNRQTGSVAIYSAYAQRALTNVRMTATPKNSGYSGQLTVLTLSGAATTGVAGVTGLQRGAPSVYLPGVGAMSTVIGVGVDPDGAVSRGIPSDELVSEFVSPGPGAEQDTGATFWVQSLPNQTPISGLVTLTTPGRTDHQWNMAAVEVKPNRAVSITPRPPIDPSVKNPGIRPPIRGHHG